MTIAWIIGSKGLLGSAIARVLKRQKLSVFSPDQRITWEREADIEGQLRAAIAAFATQVRSEKCWEIYWVAGVGTMGSTDDELGLEKRVLASLLRIIEGNVELMTHSGALAFASSAGAIYAGSRVEVIDEATPIAPTTPYARAKLEQEELIRAFLSKTNVTGLLARMTTLYGPGQTTAKQQGLIAHIARSVVRNRPIQIYVPFETIRDYIWIDDAAISMVNNLRGVCAQSRILTKIIASELPVTIAEILAIFRRLTRRPIRIVTSAGRLTSVYSRRVHFSSTTGIEMASLNQTTLLIGIAQVLATERRAYIESTPPRLQ